MLKFEKNRATTTIVSKATVTYLHLIEEEKTEEEKKQPSNRNECDKLKKENPVEKKIKLKLQIKLKLFIWLVTVDIGRCQPTLLTST